MPFCSKYKLRVLQLMRICIWLAVMPYVVGTLVANGQNISSSSPYPISTNFTETKTSKPNESVLVPTRTQSRSKELPISPTVKGAHSISRSRTVTRSIPKQSLPTGPTGPTTTPYGGEYWPNPVTSTTTKPSATPAATEDPTMWDICELKFILPATYVTPTSTVTTTATNLSNASTALPSTTVATELPGALPTPPLARADINRLLLAHNNARRSVSPFAKAMPMLVWNSSLAEKAQRYAEAAGPAEVLKYVLSTTEGTLLWKASDSFCGEGAVTQRFKDSGPSASASASTASYRWVRQFEGDYLATPVPVGSITREDGNATDMFISDKQFFTYPTYCSPPSKSNCSAYRQMIWSMASSLGCGASRVLLSASQIAKQELQTSSTSTTSAPSSEGASQLTGLANTNQSTNASRTAVTTIIEGITVWVCLYDNRAPFTCGSSFAAPYVAAENIAAIDECSFALPRPTLSTTSPSTPVAVTVSGVAATSSAGGNELTTAQWTTDSPTTLMLTSTSTTTTTAAPTPPPLDACDSEYLILSTTTSTSATTTLPSTDLPADQQQFTNSSSMANASEGEFASPPPPISSTLPLPTSASTTATQSPSDTQQQPLNISEINSILKAHNDVRRRVYPYPRGMPMLRWSQRLADFSLSKVAPCTGLAPTPLAERSNESALGWSYVGENQVAGTKLDSGASAVAVWVNEAKNFVFPDICASGTTCFHYQQIIWATTTQVGCGHSYCPSLSYKHYWMCAYGLGGLTDTRPYANTTLYSEAAVCSIRRVQNATQTTTTTALPTLSTPPPTTATTTTTQIPKNNSCVVTYVPQQEQQTVTTTGTTAATSEPELTDTSTPTPAPWLKLSDINDLLRAHNEARRAVYPYATSMPMLQWSTSLADYAQGHADQCADTALSDIDDRMNTSRFVWWFVGESVGTVLAQKVASTAVAVLGPTNQPQNKRFRAMVGDDGEVDTPAPTLLAPNATDITTQWFSEAEQFRFQYPRCVAAGTSLGCLEYLQAVWADTTHVGCAVQLCADPDGGMTSVGRWQWVCNYGPGGNLADQVPYVATYNLTMSSMCSSDRSLDVVPPRPTTATTIATTTLTTNATEGNFSGNWTLQTTAPILNGTMYPQGNASARGYYTANEILSLWQRPPPTGPILTHENMIVIDSGAVNILTRRPWTRILLALIVLLFSC